MVDQTSKIESQYVITSDSSSINKAVKDTDKFRASVADTDQEVDVLDKSLLALDAQAQATGKQIAESMKEAREETSLLGVEAKEAARQLRLAEEERAKRPPPPPPGLGTSVGGLARGAAGLQRAVPGLGGGGGLEATQGIARLTEALPQLKKSISGIPSIAKSAAQALGPAGVGVGAVLIGLVVIAKKVSDDIKEVTQELEAGISANERYAEAVAKGSAEAVQAEIDLIEHNRIKREIELEGLERSKRIIQDQVANTNILEGALIGAADLLGTVPLETVQKEIVDLGLAVEEDEILLRRLNEALADGTIPLENLADVARDASMAAGDRVRLEQELAQITTEEAQNRLTAINNQSEALQAELAVLKNSGDTTAATTDRIAELEKELGRLGDESTAVSDTLASGAIAAREAAEAQVEASEKIATARDKAADQVAQAEARYTQSISDIAQSTTQSINDAIAAVNERTVDLADKLTSDLTKISIKGSESFTELLEDIAKAELKTKKDTAKELRKIDQQAEDSITDALDERNVLRLLDINKQRKRDRRDRKVEAKDKELEFAEEARERKIKEREDLRETRQDRLAAFEEQQDDLDKNLDRQIDKINQSEDRRIAQAEKARRRALEVAQEGLDKELELFRKFFDELNRETGSGLRGAGRKKKRGRGISLAPRQFASSTITG